MTPTVSQGAVDDGQGVFDLGVTAPVLLRLALGTTRSIPPATDWDAVFTMGIAERCAGVAWSRSGPIIRAYAPGSTVARWRALALQSDAFNKRQLHVLASLVAGLYRAGVKPVVLKGLPLAQRLYGDAAARTSADIDVFVPVASRAAAERALLEMAWCIVEGRAPWTQTFSTTLNSERFYLEIHSSLVDLNLLHLHPPAPVGRDITVQSVSLPVHDDDMLPAYLAAHAAKHMPAALLYDIDFHTLWGSLTEQEREAALRQSDAAGLRGYLTWMIERSRAVTAAASGEGWALTLLGITAEGRATRHAVFRDVALAPSPLAAAQAVAAWVWPPHLRATPGPFLRRCAERLQGPLGRHFRKRQAYVTSGTEGDGWVGH